MPLVGDFVWHDLNLNGRQDGGEAGIAGVTVIVSDLAHGLVGTTTTDVNGAYQFNLAAGDYILSFLTPTGYVTTKQHSPVAVSSTDSDPGIGDLTFTVGALDVTNLDAGYYQIPVLNNLDTDSVTFSEDGPAVHLDAGADAAITDGDGTLFRWSDNFDGVAPYSSGSLRVSILAGGVAAEDVLRFDPASSITLSNAYNADSIVSVGGIAIGTIAANGDGSDGHDLVVNFSTDDDNVTQANVATLIQSVTYANSNIGNPTTGDRTVTVSLGADRLDAATTVATTVHVQAANDAPTTQPATVLAAEDTSYIFQLSDFAFDDSTDDPNPDSFANVLIRSLPGAGTLLFDADGAGAGAAVAVRIGEVISAADIAAGRLTYVSGADGNGTGYATFDFQVQDDGAGPTLYATGYNPHDVTAVDVNHDNKLDLVYVTEAGPSGQIGVRFGAGDGRFGAETRYAAGDTPTAMIATDLDGDNNPDLVVANHAIGIVQVLKGNADGTFDSAVTIANAQSVAMLTGDFNHDGFADLAIADREQYLVRILLGDGSGTSFSATTYDNGSNQVIVTGVAAADFNEDGNIDLVFANECDQFGNFFTGNITMVLGNADGSFQGPQTLASNLLFPYTVKTADLNNDGNVDLVYDLIGPSPAVVVHLGNGDGTFGTASTIAMPSPPIDISLTDIDGDGKLDIVVDDYQSPVGSLSALRGNGDGTFQSAIQIPTAAYPYSLAAGDFNGDGNVDFVTTNTNDNNLAVLLNGPSLLANNRNISATATITIDVAGVNDAPVNTIAAQTGLQGTDTPITGLSVSDVDIDTGQITVTLTVQHGTIHVADDVPGGLNALDITNNDTASVTLNCDINLLNATLAALNGVVYRPTGSYVGTDTLTMLSDDGGGSGTGGAKTDSDTVNLVVAPAHIEPTLTATAANPTYVENGSPATLFSGAAASTVEAGQTINSMTLTVSGLANGGDELLFIDGSHVALTDGNSIFTATNGLTVNVSVTGNTATATFTGASLSTTDFQTLVNTLGYSVSGDAPTAANRTVTITEIVDSGVNTPPNDNTRALNIVSTVGVTAVNDAPTVNRPAGANVSATKGQTLQVSNLFSGSDVDSGTLTYFLYDGNTAANSGRFMIGGNAVAAGTIVQVTAAQLAQATFVAGTYGTSDSIAVQAYDGTAYSGWNAIVNVSVPANRAPTVSLPSGASVKPTSGQTMTLSSLFSGNDLDGDALTYYVYDASPAANSGRVKIGSTTVAAQTITAMTASQFAQATFVAGAAGSVDNIYVQTFDGTAYSGWNASVNLAVPTGTNQAPTVSRPAGASVAPTSGQTLQVSSLFAGSDVNGNTLTYFLYDGNSAANSGHFVVGGNIVPAGTIYALSAAQLAQATFVTGADGTSDNLAVQAYDGAAYSGWNAVVNVAVPAGANNGPTVGLPSGASVAPTAGQTMLVSSLFSGGDVDGNTLTYLVYDGSAAANSGHFVVGGNTVAAGTITAMTAAQFAQATFVAGAAGMSDSISVQTFDGQLYSGWNAIVNVAVPAGTNHAPTVNLPSGNSANPSAGQTLQMSSLFSGSDVDGNTLTYFVYDSGAAANSGHVVIDGNTVAAQTITAMTAAQLATATFVAGDAGTSDDIFVQAFDGQLYSGWASSVHLFV